MTKLSKMASVTTTKTGKITYNPALLNVKKGPEVLLDDWNKHRRWMRI